MSWILRVAALAVALFAISTTARAQESRFGLGVSWSAGDGHVQADLDVTRKLGLQAAVGGSGSSLELSAKLGARFYLLHVLGLASPYVGGFLLQRYGPRVLWSLEALNDSGRARFAGATSGVRIRSKQGIGGFLQLELLRALSPPSDQEWVPSVGAGLQWWF